MTIRFVIYRMNLDRVQYAQMWLTNDIFNVWNRRYESLNENSIWKFFKKTFQKHFIFQRFHLINVSQRFKELKQRFKQLVSQLCAHLNHLKNQFSDDFININVQIICFSHYIFIFVMQSYESMKTAWQKCK
jgi:hypothetical protein